MESVSIWSKALTILKFDSSVNGVIYDSFICKLKEEYFGNNVLVLSCKDEYSLGIVKSGDTVAAITNAVKTANNDGKISIQFVLEGDKSSIETSRIAAMKSISNGQGNFSNNKTGLDPDLTFEKFIVGECNRFAHASAVSIANNPGVPQRNPLFLWGGSGLGKTHLMEAIGNKISREKPDKSVIYITCENFVNQYVECVRSNNYQPFREKFRFTDVLLIDDIQFLIGRNQVQVEFFNTFESLISAGKQIVITSDKPPKSLTELDARLTSRFQSGVTMDIQPPDFETRKAILVSKVSFENINISEEIIDYIAENVTSSIRELNGAYNTVSSYIALLDGNTISFETAQNILSSYVNPGKKVQITIDMITNYVCNYYSITMDKIKSENRSKAVVVPRSVAMYLCRLYLDDMTLGDIGNYYGGKKHSTVLNSITKIESDKEAMKDIEEIKKLLNNI